MHTDEQMLLADSDILRRRGTARCGNTPWARIRSDMPKSYLHVGDYWLTITPEIEAAFDEAVRKLGDGWRDDQCALVRLWASLL